MAAKTKAPDTATIDAELVSVEDLRRQLEGQLAEVEEKIAARRGAPAPELEGEHASLTARLASIPTRLRQLTETREQAESAETLKLFEQWHGDKHAAYTLAYEIDQKIKALMEQVNELSKKRQEVLVPIQLLNGRLSDLQEAIRRLNLSQAVKEIRRKFPRVGNYM